MPAPGWNLQVLDEQGKPIEKLPANRRIVTTVACDDDINKGVQVVEETMQAHPDLNGWFFVGLWPLFAEKGSMKLWEEATAFVAKTRAADAVTAAAPTREAYAAASARPEPVPSFHASAAVNASPAPMVTSWMGGRDDDSSAALPAAVTRNTLPWE